MPPMSLNFTRTGNSQCGNVDILVNSGVSPFQVEIIPEYRQQKTLHFATNKFGFALDLPASIPYLLVVTDAESNSAVEGLLAVGSSSDNSCLNAATTMTIGMFTSVFSGSGVLMPSSTLAATSTSISTSTDTTITAGATQQGSSGSSTTSKISIGEIVGIAAAGVVVTAMLALLVWWLLRRRAAATANQPEGDGSKPETHPTSLGYSLPYTTRYAYSGAPQIQEASTSIIGPYTPPGVIPTSQSHAFHASPITVQYAGITTHAPQPRPPAQLVGHYSVSGEDQQSPASHSFSQNTVTTTPTVGIRNSLESGPTDRSWGTEKRERFVSSSSPSHNGGQADPWGLTTSPPPRSQTGTALPPYEFVPQEQEHRRG
ncbi:hypothetical protein FRC07_004502 [Ceratobasidium sp. 392]|nr:hypothetical protein FRC07_004502 [Ceratobasidium sp. 392]